MLPAAKLLALTAQLLPAIHEPLGPDIGVLQGGVFTLHACDDMGDTLPTGKLRSWRAPSVDHAAVSKPSILLSPRALVELLAGRVHLLPLHVKNRQAITLVLIERLIGPHIAVNGCLKRRLTS